MRERLASILRALADRLDPTAGQRVLASLYASQETATALQSELAREMVAQSLESRALAAQIARYDVTPTQADRMAGTPSVVPISRFALRAGRLKALR